MNAARIVGSLSSLAGGVQPTRHAGGNRFAGGYRRTSVRTMSRTRSVR
jgi:hypothetical protein